MLSLTMSYTCPRCGTVYRSSLTDQEDAEEDISRFARFHRQSHDGAGREETTWSKARHLDSQLGI